MHLGASALSKCLHTGRKRPHSRQASTLHQTCRAGGACHYMPGLLEECICRRNLMHAARNQNALTRMSTGSLLCTDSVMTVRSCVG